MPHPLALKPTTTSTPQTVIVIMADGSVRQLAWAEGLAALFATTSHTHAASAITSGVLDPARIPVLTSFDSLIPAGGTIASLTNDEQTSVNSQTVVITSDGKRWVYKGSGSKTSSSNYIELGDVTPDWSVVANKPSVLTAGLATGGGSLGTDRTVTVPAASDDDARTGSSTTKAMTPAAVLAAIYHFTQGLSVWGSGFALVTETDSSLAPQLGNLRAPFGTLQSALDAGAYHIMCIGSVGDATLPGNTTITFMGLGTAFSQIGTLSVPHDTIVQGNGREQIQISAINYFNSASDGSAGTYPGGNGGDGGASTVNTELRNVFVAGSITLFPTNGGAGGNGQDGDESNPGGSGGSGGDGGTNGQLIITDCCITGSVNCTGGPGGEPGLPGSDGGAGAGNSGLGGSGGNGGSITLIRSIVQSGVVNLASGTPGSGGSPGTPGSISLISSTLENLPTGPSNAATCVASIVAGAFYANSYP